MGDSVHNGQPIASRGLGLSSWGSVSNLFILSGNLMLAYQGDRSDSVMSLLIHSRSGETGDQCAPTPACDRRKDLRLSDIAYSRLPSLRYVPGPVR